MCYLKVAVLVTVCFVSSRFGYADELEAAMFERASDLISRRDVDGFRRLLMDEPALATMKGPHGETLLNLVAIWASDNKPAHAEIAQLLIDAGADVNAYGIGGQTPLLAATYPRSKQVVDVLLAAGADVRAGERPPGVERIPLEFQHYEDFPCPIDIAASQGFPYLVEKLLSLDVRIEYPETQRYAGMPPVKDSVLHFACKNRVNSKSTQDVRADACRTIDLLCARISDVNLRNFLRHTPLHLAAEYGSDVIVDHLLTNYQNVDINSQDLDGNTPLHLAVDAPSIGDHHGYNVGLSPELSEAVVRVLLKHGAKTDITNHKRQTPLDAAREEASGTCGPAEREIMAGWPGCGCHGSVSRAFSKGDFT